MSNTKVYLAPMEGLTDYMFRNAFDEFFGHGKIDKYFMPFISPSDIMKLTLMQAVPLEQSFPNPKAQECLQILTGLNAYFMK